MSQKDIKIIKDTLLDWDVQTVRDAFPLLSTQVNKKPLIYLDNAATTQKPQLMLNAMSHYYRTENANVHRGVHALSERATAHYESAREVVRAFINAASEREIIFVRGTTEAINLVAQSYGRSQLKAGDEIILSAMEHHSNIVPWQLLQEQIGVVIKVIPMNHHAELDLEAYEALITERTRLVSVVHVSNALGTVNPIEAIIEKAHQHDIPVLVDGAQATPHMQVDVQALDCDFYAFSGHKMYGPTGIGVLYGKKALLDAMPPYQGGGDMIRTVSFERSTYAPLPAKFEAGTPNIAGAIGLGAAITYLNDLGMAEIEAYERELLHYATHALNEIEGVEIIGQALDKAGVISFIMEGIHPHDIGSIVDSEGVAIRVGHHCAMPVMQFYGVPATARMSLGLYNTHQEIDSLVKALYLVKEMFEQ